MQAGTNDSLVQQHNQVATDPLTPRIDSSRLTQAYGRQTKSPGTCYYFRITLANLRIPKNVKRNQCFQPLTRFRVGAHFVLGRLDLSIPSEATYLVKHPKMQRGAPSDLTSRSPPEFRFECPVSSLYSSHESIPKLGDCLSSFCWLIFHGARLKFLHTAPKASRKHPVDGEHRSLSISNEFSTR